MRFCRALRGAASCVYCIWNSPLSLKSLSQRCLPQSGRRRQLRSTVASSEVSSSSAVLCFPSCCLRPRSSLRPHFSASQDFFVRAVFFVHTHVRSKGIDENYRHRFFLFFRIRFKFRGLGRKNAKIRVGCFFVVYEKNAQTQKTQIGPKKRKKAKIRARQKFRIRPIRGAPNEDQMSSCLARFSLDSNL